jgi:hypothetical protein
MDRGVATAGRNLSLEAFSRDTVGLGFTLGCEETEVAAMTAGRAPTAQQVNQALELVTRHRQASSTER